MLLSWMPSMRLGSRKRSFLALSVAALAAGALALLGALSFGATGASAALTTERNCALPGSDFQGGDGNQATPTVEEQTFCTTEHLLPTARDWQSIASSVTNSPDPNAKDSEFEGGNKETEPNKWGIKLATGPVSPPKTNILSGWSQAEPKEAATFLYLAFEREATTGDTFLTFELNQVKGLWENENKAMIPCRTTGDVLIAYNVPGKPPVGVVLYRWVTDEFTETATTEDPTLHQCAKNGHFEPAEGDAVKTPDEQGEMNFTEEIKNYLKTEGTTPENFQLGSFGEAALNLTHIFEGAELGPCFSFGQMWMSSRSSESIDSQLQDYVSPVGILANSCSISGRKFDDANGSKEDLPSKPGLSGWTIQLLDSKEKVLAETKTDSEGNYTFTDVGPGSYIVREVGQTGWTCDYPGEGSSCQHSVTIGSSNINSTGNDFGNKPTSEVLTTQEPKSGAVGTKFGDSATVSGPKGTPTPTGEVEFNLYNNETCNPASGGLIAGPIKVTLSEGKAAIPNASKVALTKSGTYYWVATYGGDEFNAEASSGCNDEPVTVEKAKPSIATTPSGSVTVGEKVKDSATLKGLVEATGAGKVTFKLYEDNKCEHEVTHFESTGIGGTGEVTVNSGEYTTTKAGTYYWVATYPGDANNEPAATKCGDETVVVNPAEPRITTKAVTPVTVGAKIHDTATLSGLVNPDGTGKVTFKLYSDSGCATKVFESTNPTSGGVGANGNVESSEYTATAAGTYYWVASYSGDANNVSVSTSCKDAEESSVVNRAKPSIGTTPSGTVTVGQNIKDSATLKGLVNATGAGKVTFKLYSDAKCETEVTHFESTGIGGTGEVTVNSGEYTTTKAGTYYWIATYPGDANNEPAATKCGDETVVVNKAQPAISTKAVTPVTVGAKIHDTATLSGLVNPDGTGKVTFKLYSDSGCATKVFESTNPTSGGIGANGNVESSEYTTTAAGTYYWVASYSGDANNVSVSTSCKDAEESSVVEKTKPGISTKATPEVVVGESIKDTATLTGLVNATSGTVTFKLFSDSSCSTEVTAAKSTSAAVVGSGTIDVPSGEYKTTTAGTYFWIASYSGDSNNGSVTSGCKDTNESTVVNKAQPAISTTASGSVVFGGSLHDTAHLSGGFAPTGKIVFKLFAASDTSCATVLKTVETEVGKGNGDYESPSVTVGVGSYQWVAEYSGDQNNVAATTSCNDAAEQASVTEHPGIAVVKEQQIAGSGQPFTTAPLEAKVGQQINYRITVTNTGDVPLALSFSDPHCDTGTITGPTGNLNADGTLPAGGVAQYFCSHVMQSGDAPQLTNAATVTGQPPSGPPVSATASVVVNVAKAVVEAKCTLVLSSIVLHGAGGSRRKPFTVSISSLGIEQITFYLDKHKIKTLTQKQAKHGKYTIKIDPRKLRYGAHTVSIKTVMTDKACAALARSGVFVHPRPPVVKPKFTG